MANTYLGPKGIISAEEAAKMEVVVYGACPYPDYVVAFETQDDFYRWSQTLQYKDRIADGLKRTDVARTYKDKDTFKIVEAQRAAVKETSVKIATLAESM